MHHTKIHFNEACRRVCIRHTAQTTNRQRTRDLKCTNITPRTALSCEIEASCAFLPKNTAPQIRTRAVSSRKRDLQTREMSPVYNFSRKAARLKGLEQLAQKCLQKSTTNTQKRPTNTGNEPRI